jgi:diamine N-acetyltransferase
MRDDESISLRALEPDDIELLYDWENNRENWRISNTQVPFSKYILQKYIENSHLDIYQTKQLRMMIDLISHERIRSIGCVDLFDFDPFHSRVGIGILIADKEDRSRGYASKALKEIMQYAFHYLHIHQLYCNITSDNTSSLKLFQNAGFNITGTKKDWIKHNEGYLDEIILQLIEKKEL